MAEKSTRAAAHKAHTLLCCSSSKKVQAGRTQAPHLAAQVTIQKRLDLSAQHTMALHRRSASSRRPARAQAPTAELAA